MRKILLSFAILFVACLGVFSQTNDESIWNTYLKRDITTYTVSAENNMFAISDGALYSVSKKNNNEYKLWDRQDGLSEVQIVNMEYSKSNETLILYYRSGVIDLLTENGISHINDIAMSDNIPDKTIDRIYDFSRDVCFLSGNLGVVDINLNEKVINGTYFASQQISSLAYMDKQNLLAVALGGTFRVGDRSKNLQDPFNWKTNSSIPNTVKNVASFNDLFVLLFEDGSTKFVNKNGDFVDTPASLQSLPSSLDKIVDYRFGFVAFYQNKVYVIKNDSSIKTRNIEGNIWVSYDGNTMTQSVGDNGFKVYNLLDESKSKHINIKFNSPSTNNFYFTRVQDSKLMAVNGGRYFDRFYQKGEINVFDGKNWRSVNSYAITDKIGSTFNDPIDIIIHNSGKPYYYVATWGEGIIKLDENLNFIQHYNDKNSSLVSAVPNSPNYIRVASLSIDEKNNLWMTMGTSPKPIASMSADGKWVNYDVAQIKGSNAFGTMICLPNGVKYILDFFLQDKGEGFTILKTNGTEYNNSTCYTQHFSSVQEYNGKAVNFSIVNCMALDKKGAMWFGSDIGFFIINQPSNLPKRGVLPIVSRPVGGSEPPYYRILDNVNIKAIAVDNLNNKWLGTADDGIYLLSEDGSKVIAHYNMSNSPLVSNSISSLSFDDKNGILYIGTPYGLNSLRLSMDYGNQNNLPYLKVFPNPLRPEDRDLITISGLNQGMTITVFDASGSMVHTDQVISSVYEWIPRTLSGNRLPSGIYTIIVGSKENSINKTIKVGIVR